MNSIKVGAIAAAAVLVAAACQGPGTTGKVLKFGVELPLSGGEAPNGQPTLKGAKLAVDEFNKAGGAGGYTLELVVKDDAVNGKNNPDQGAKNMTDLVNDPAVIGVVGPYNSAVAKVQIPISNEAGLLQCSPANTNETLTKTKDYRPKFPDRINYIRVATTDDVQGPAGASFAYTDNNVRSILIVDDVTTFGKGVADNFQKKFTDLGGTVTDRIGADKNTTDFLPILTQAKAKNPEGVYYGGVTTSGGGLLRKQMADPAIGMGNLPFFGPDGIVDGGGGATGSFINIAGAAAANSFGTIAAIGDFPAKADFDARYTAAYTNDPDFKTPGAYSGPAYACAQVIIASLKASISQAGDLAKLREAVRAYATDPSRKFDTVLGTINFDANGDTSQLIISFYKVDPTAAAGKGDWVFSKQQDFAP